MLAALAGLAVGMPTLRLRGDYLAIVTLGFGEIIRVILQNMDCVGGASGLKGFRIKPIFSGLWLARDGLCRRRLVNSTYGRGFIAVHDDEVPRGRWASTRPATRSRRS